MGRSGFPVGARTTLTVGGIAYIYPNKAGLTSDANTLEIYGKVAFDVPFSPKAAVQYDVDKIKGAYFEGSISHTVPASEKVSVVLGALAGLSAGQGGLLTSISQPGCRSPQGYSRSFRRFIL